MKNESVFNYDSYKKGVVKFGRITLVLAIIASFLPHIYMAVRYDLTPNFADVMKAFIPMSLAWGILWLVEPISYFPVLGITGTYMSWLSGEILSLRIPCSVMAQQVAEVKEGTLEGDIISTLGIAVSVVVNILIVALFAFAGVQILAVMPESLKESFNYILPSIYGAMFASFAFRNGKIAVLALVISIIVKLIGVSTGMELLLVVFPTLIISMILYKKGLV